jgi:thiol-disulfide isomerase/thioredoxin
MSDQGAERAGDRTGDRRGSGRLVGPIVVSAGAGVVAVVGVFLVAGVADGDPTPVDGEFVLVEPGIYDEPVDGSIDPDGIDTVEAERLPEVAVSDVDGRPVVLADHRGSPMVVNFWFSRCAPCRRELRDFAAVHAEVGDRVRFVGVDPFDTVDSMVAFAEERGVTYELLRDVGDHDARLLTDELGLVAYPVTLFVDGDGRIVRRTGELDADDLRAAIAELF